ncbi:CGNR zinc finger domain-containing protein [Kribbella italica]|uniref:Putative RNA-binding Zn ribbon-like protein n=1 Tax=Kribbella italica TaxID=1540520 RepID=A0A7W9J5V8_9ACTN|nr:CGNR zinc finger domain-containing protein [Kribbella italica]MBB5836201.1 putative RNA-binding Zn ribbon-like protein [Kribbella italica]
MTTDEQLLLDLLNSTPLVAGVEQDRLKETAAWAETPGRDGRRALVAVRSALQNVVRGEEAPSALTPFLRDVRQVPAMTPDGVTWTLEAPAAHRTAIRAILAWNELKATKPGRLRPCENPECQLFLIDRSKANTARWCSMASCGNRLKARRHYEAKTRGTA